MEKESKRDAFLIYRMTFGNVMAKRCLPSVTYLEYQLMNLFSNFICPLFVYLKKKNYFCSRD